ncbi:MAG: hypothetical protein PHQ61_07425, partial [Candidatus Omnitrophica bacterium]|nr:hypothetical protein [Candidatus Omnitrophota bacterium]
MFRYRRRPFDGAHGISSDIGRGSLTSALPRGVVPLGRAPEDLKRLEFEIYVRKNGIYSSDIGGEVFC